MIFSKNKSSFNKVIYVSKNFNTLIEDRKSFIGESIEKLFPKFRR